MAKRKASLLSISTLLLALLSQSSSATTTAEDTSNPTTSSSSVSETTVTLIEVANAIPLVASVIAATSSLTTYSLACRHSPHHPIGSTACSNVAAVKITQGPSSLSLVTTSTMRLDTASAMSSVDVDLACALTGTSRAVCTQQYRGLQLPHIPVGVLNPKSLDFVMANIARITEAKTVTLTGAALKFSPVVVTAGAEKLSREEEAEVESNDNVTVSSQQRLQRPPDNLKRKIAPQLIGLGAGLLAIISL